MSIALQPSFSIKLYWRLIVYSYAEWSATHEAKVNPNLPACVCQCLTRPYEAMQPMKQKTSKLKELLQSVQGLFTYCHGKSLCVCIGRILSMWSGSSEWLKVGDDEVMKAPAMGLNKVKSFSSVAILKGNYALKSGTRSMTYCLAKPHNIHYE